MLYIKSYLKQSEIHGIGLYAAEDIKRGKVIWKEHPKTTQTFLKKQYIKHCSQFSYPALLDFLSYSYIRNGTIYYLNDNTRFVNHSDDPNIAFITDDCEVAIRDIKAGEELTENYLLSYDKNDFFNLDIYEENGKKELLKKIKENVLELDRSQMM